MGKTFKVGDKEYDSDDLSEEARAHIEALNYVHSEILRGQRQLAALQTAQKAYAKRLKELLEEGGGGVDAGETQLPGSISFD